MKSPEIREITNTRFVQKAQVVLPLTDLRSISAAEYVAAVKVVRDVREEVLRVLGVDEKNADVTALDYDVTDTHMLVTVTQANV